MQGTIWKWEKIWRIQGVSGAEIRRQLKLCPWVMHACIISILSSFYGSRFLQLSCLQSCDTWCTPSLGGLAHSLILWSFGNLTFHYKPLLIPGLGCRLNFFCLGLLLPLVLQMKNIAICRTASCRLFSCSQKCKTALMLLALQWEDFGWGFSTLLVHKSMNIAV